MILQPNIKYVGEEYWDFFDHYTPITDKSMCEALLAVEGFNITEVIDRFLHYTTKSKIPQFPWLVRLYCHVPFAWKIMGKQMFIVAENFNLAYKGEELMLKYELLNRYCLRIILFMLVVMSTFPVYYSDIVSGLDPSWVLALNIINNNEQLFGSD